MYKFCIVLYSEEYFFLCVVLLCCEGNGIGFFGYFFCDSWFSGFFKVV